jgi:hypothetical protein
MNTTDQWLFRIIIPTSRLPVHTSIYLDLYEAPALNYVLPLLQFGVLGFTKVIFTFEAMRLANWASYVGRSGMIENMKMDGEE